MGDNDFLYKGYGDITSPIYGTDVENAQLYSVCDPVRDRLLALFSTAINYELGHHATTPTATSPWVIASAATSLAGRAPVADTLYDKPSRRLLEEAKFTFPLLALYRGIEESEEFTLEDDVITCTWGLHYILGPLQAEHARKLKAALVFAVRIVKLTIEAFGHPAYENGARQFGAGAGGLNAIDLTNNVYEPEAFSGDGPEFFAAHMTLSTSELSTEVEGLGTDYMGSTIHGGLAGPDGTLPDHIVGDTSVLVQSPIGKPQPK